MKFDDAHFAHALFQNVFIDFLDVFFDLFGKRFGRVNFKRIRRHIRHDSRRKIAGEQRRLELARERAQNLLRHTRGGRVFDLDLVRLGDRLREERDVVENDEQVKALSDNLQALQAQFDEEAVKENPDEKLLNDLQEQGSAMYQTIYQTPAMTQMMDAKEGMDSMMNEVMNFLYLVIGGADPKTVEVTPETMQQMQAEMMQM